MGIDLTARRAAIFAALCNFSAQMETAGEAEACQQTATADRMRANGGRTQNQILDDVDELIAEVRRLTRELEPYRAADRAATAAHNAWTEDLMHDGSVE